MRRRALASCRTLELTAASPTGLAGTVDVTVSHTTGGHLSKDEGRSLHLSRSAHGEEALSRQGPEQSWDGRHHHRDEPRERYGSALWTRAAKIDRDVSATKILVTAPKGIRDCRRHCDDPGGHLSKDEGRSLHLSRSAHGEEALSRQGPRAKLGRSSPSPGRTSRTLRQCTLDSRSAKIDRDVSATKILVTAPKGIRDCRRHCDDPGGHLSKDEGPDRFYY